jgi:arylsulfatase A-like enzyme
LPEFFRKGGYSTHLIGKWHLGFCAKKYLPTSRGFDEHFGFLSGQIDYSKHTVSRDPKSYSGEYLITDYYANNTVHLSENYCSNEFTDRAIQVAKNSKNSKPFFTFLTYAVPHAPTSATNWWKNKVQGRVRRIKITHVNLRHINLCNLEKYRYKIPVKNFNKK